MDFNYQEALLLLEKQQKKNPEVIKHSLAVSDLAFKTAVRLKNNDPTLELNPDELRIIGLLHDIGKDVEERPHAIVSSELLAKKGLHRISEIVKTHGITKEESELSKIPGNYYPTSLEEELLIYADMHVMHDKVVPFEERYKDLLERAKDPLKHKALLLAHRRIQKIMEKIDAMLC